MVTIINNQVTDLQDPVNPSDAMTLNAAQLSIATLPITYSNGSQKSNVVQYTSTTATLVGTSTVYLTVDGTLAGTALFPNEILATDLYISDATNIYGVGYTISSDRKTLTITANRQVFAGVTVAGVNVLGSVSLTPVANGTVVNIKVVGR